MTAERGIWINSIRDMLYVIFRHKRKILAFFFLTVLLTAAISFILPHIYESESSILIRFGRENLPSDPSIEGTLVNFSQDRANELKSEMAILSSQYLAEQVVDELGEGWILLRPEYPMADIGLEPPGPGGLVQGLSDGAKSMLVGLGLRPSESPREKAIRKLTQSLTFTLKPQSNVIHVSCQAKTPGLAQAILEHIVDAYERRHIEVYSTKATPEFFAEGSEKLHARLEGIEKDLTRYQLEYNIADIETQKRTLLAQISTLEVDLSTVNSLVNGLEAKVNTLASKVAMRDNTRELSRKTGLPNQAADTIKQRLLELYVEESDLSSRYADEYRPLVEVQQQITLLEEKLEKETPTLTEVTVGVDKNTEALEQLFEEENANLVAAQSQRDTLSSELETIKASLSELVRHETDYNTLLRDKKLAEDEYLAYMDHLQEANIAKALEQDQISNVSVVEPPSLPVRPIRPAKLRNIILSMFIGLFGGIALAFVSEFMDDTLNTAGSVEGRLGLEHLASFSDKDIDQCT